jgi:hypothetical protein
MAHLRATASAARSVLDGCEHDGMLSRVGSRLPKLTNRTIKKRETKHIKKQDHAHWWRYGGFHSVAEAPLIIEAESPVHARLLAAVNEVGRASLLAEGYPGRAIVAHEPRGPVLTPLSHGKTSSRIA